METLHVAEQPVVTGQARTIGFWQRQFGPVRTRPQNIFDVVFGVIGPVLCFAFDPLVFRDGFGPPLFPDYQTFAYLFSGAQIVLLSFWLLTGPGPALWNRLLGGMMLAGSLFCLTVGLVLAPFSLIGVMFGIGIFGFTPFLSALVYLRNSRRALRAGGENLPAFSRRIVTACGILLAAGLPLLLSIQIDRAVSNAVTEIVEGDPQHAIFAAHRLTPLRIFADGELDRIVNAYNTEPDVKRKELLKSCYQEITGESIENHVTRLPD